VSAARARDLGIRIGDYQPGPNNAITDVSGVRVGYSTIIEGDGPLQVGVGPVRTGVTVIFPHDGNVWTEGIFAGCHRLNGNGELTGLEWIRESGMLFGAVGITNTHSVGAVRDAIIAWNVHRRDPREIFWVLPVVGETYDGMLNDINGMHVTQRHVFDALESATDGPIAEGNVGGGTGMICHGFKGGTGTASRVVPAQVGGYTVGVLVQANYGSRHRLRIEGVPVGREIGPEEVPLPGARRDETGSIIIVVATDAPLLPVQLDRIAQRAGLGVARMGGVGGHSSGDIFLAFSTGNRGMQTGEEPEGSLTYQVTALSNAYITPLFEATVEATEEAIVNAMLAAETMTGRDGNTAYALPHDRLVQVMEG
jgi:D-aminopeptidase